jgi:hypothetical protein
MIDQAPRASVSARLVRWSVVTAICVAAALFGYFQLEWQGYIQTWGGALFRAASGGALGWVVSRYVLGLDLSEIPAMLRPTAAVSQAFLVGAGAIAVAVGV